VYEKAMNRRNVQMFKPDSALQEFDPRVRESRDTFEGRYRLCQQFCQVRYYPTFLGNKKEKRTKHSKPVAFLFRLRRFMGLWVDWLSP
jgi:hypothetical protein